MVNARSRLHWHRCNSNIYKSDYKNKLLETLVTTASNIEALQVIAKQLAAGVAVYKHGSPSNTSDATDLVTFACYKVNKEQCLRSQENLLYDVCDEL